MDTSVVPLVALGFSVLVGTGAVGFVFRYGVRLAVQESLLKNLREDVESKLVRKEQLIEALREGHGNTDRRVTVVETAVLNIEKALPDLQKLAAIPERLHELLEGLKNLVPREEFKAAMQSVTAKSRRRQ